MSAPAAASPAAATGSGSKRSFPGARADPERRVQPRHFHAGPNPAAAAASASGHGAHADQLTPAARLYRHALESVFAFLDQHELVTVLQVSKSWLAAFEFMSSLRLALCSPTAPLREVAESAMGRHIAELGSTDNRVPFNTDLLFTVAWLMPQLRVLTCEMQLTPTQGPLTFPPALLKLDLRVTGDLAAADVNAVIRVISLLPLLESFAIRLDSINDQLSFASLASLPHLSHLILAPSFGVELSDVQVAELRALPHLRRLHVWFMTSSLLRRLLAQPHQLQWQEISMPHRLDDEAAALLPQLPSLTKIDAFCSGSHFDWLQRLPSLAHANIHAQQFVGYVGTVVESLVAGLQRCTQIEHLSLCCPGLLTAHLADLLPRLPRLRALELFKVNIASLFFLALPPMTNQLVSLGLFSCRHLPLTELRHVHSLRALTSLRLHQSFNERMDSYSQSLYTPPSLLLPQLVNFSYCATEDEEQDAESVDELE